MSRIVGVLRRLGERIPGRGSVAEVTIANEAIQLVATELNLSFEVDLRAPDIDKDDERFIQSRYAADADPSTWPRRPVVVSLVGHVDHGKTTLLDALRCSRLASGEVGGITQRIGAFALRLSDEAWATVLDTPGHGAFMTMRANACRLTDVVVLVVAADASVQAQTIASIQAIQAEHLPMVVALTKCDLPGADLDRVRRDLLDHGVMCESLGGDVQMVPVSAVNNHGLEALKEAIALAGEMAEPAAPRHGPARAVVIDSYVERGRGTMISAMVRRGTLRIGDVVLAGPCFGVVKSMYDDAGRAVREATPAQAVQLSGLKESPDPGSDMIVVDTEQRARRMASRRIWLQEQQQLANTPLWKASEASSSPGTVTESVASVRKCLRMIVRADLAGSVTALSEFIASLPQDKVQLQIMSQAVGNITEQDLDLAKQAGATIFGFNVTLSGALKKIARSAEIDVKTQKIIYKMMDSIIESINLLMPSNQVIESVGRAEIATMFDLKGNRGKVSHRVAGCRVLAGAMKRSARVRLIRSGSTVWEGAMHSLKHFKDDVPTVEKGSECGIVLEGFDDLKQGDVIECFQHKHVQEKLVYRPSDSFTQRTAHQY